MGCSSRYISKVAKKVNDAFPSGKKKNTTQKTPKNKTKQQQQNKTKQTPKPSSSHSWQTGDTHWRKAFYDATCMHTHPFCKELQLLLLLVCLICKYTKSSVRKEFTLIFSQGFKICLTHHTLFHTRYKETGSHSSRNCGPLLKQQTRTRAPACPNDTTWKGDPRNMVSQKRKLDTQNLCWEVLKKTTL